MSKIFSSLTDDGVLFVGYSESLQFMHDKFKMVINDEAVFYEKNREKDDLFIFIFTQLGSSTL